MSLNTNKEALLALASSLEDKVYNDYNSGKKAEYDRFWNAYLGVETQKSTINLFSGRGWNDSTFYPDRDVTINNAYMLFRECLINDIGQRLKQQGVTFTFTTDTLPYSFHGTQTKTLDNMVFTKPITDMTSTFNSAVYLEHIVPTIPVQDVNLITAFAWCSYLKEVRFSGTIAMNANFVHCGNLSDQSVESIIGALKDMTGQTAQNLTLHKNVGSKLTQTQKDTIAAKNWTLIY